MDIVERLRQLSRAAADCQWREFSMRVPAEPDRDADLVLARSADEIERLREELHDYQHASAVANDCIATLRAENAKLRDERDALQERWKQFEEYDCDELKAAYALVDKVKQERDALAATVDFLRSELDDLARHSAERENCDVCKVLASANNPAAILAARDARVKAEALRDYGKHKDFCQAHKGGVCNCGLLYAIEKGTT